MYLWIIGINMSYIAYISNDNAASAAVSGVSNGFLLQWPKVKKGIATLKDVLAEQQQQLQGNVCVLHHPVTAMHCLAAHILLTRFTQLPCIGNHPVILLLSLYVWFVLWTDPTCGVVCVMM